MAGDKKTSQLPIMNPSDLVATDGVLVLDKSATTGEGSGPGGTLKVMNAAGVSPFTTSTGVVRNMNLLGINTNQSLFKWAADAINAFGPYTAARGQDFLFRSVQTGGVYGPNSITVTYFKLLSGRLIAGGSSNLISPGELVLSGGPYITNPEINADLFLEIGDAGVGPIEDYFNLGKDHFPSGDPWTIDGQQFLTGTLDGEPTIWQFLAGDGDWGGVSGNDTVADDFINLSLQPPVNTNPQTKIHPLSLSGIALVNPVTGAPIAELNYIAAAVHTYGPFTCLPGQQMVLKTSTIVGGVGGGGSFNVSTRFYRVIPNVTVIGGPLTATPPPSSFMPDGQGLVRIEETDDALFAELGDISTGPVEDYFNLGEETSPSVFEPWDMTVKRFVRAELDGDITLWAFVGIEGLYGGPDMGTDPDILEAVATDFFDITEQPEVLSIENNIIKTINVLNTDLATLDGTGLATYFNAIDPPILKQGFESWRINIVDGTDAILKTFDLVNRGKGPVGLTGNIANNLTAAMFFEVNKGDGSGDMLASVYDPTNKSANAFAMDNMAKPTAAKTTPIDADSLTIWDSVTSLFKELTFANLKTYLNTLYKSVMSPQFEWSANTTIASTHNNAMIFVVGYTTTVNPTTQTYAANFESFLDNTGSATGASIVCTASTTGGTWTYSVNGATPVTSGTFTLGAKKLCYITRKLSSNLIKINGDVT